MNIQVVYSWLKVFLAAVLTSLLTILISTGSWPTNGEGWTAVAVSGLVAVIPVIVNWLNPNYTMYGKGSE